MLDKLDKIWIGLIFGILLPFFLFTCFWLFAHSQIGFPMRFIEYLRTGNMFQEVVIICIGGNLLVFYLLLNQKVYDLCKGMMYSTFAYVALTLYISLL